MTPIELLAEVQKVAPQFEWNIDEGTNDVFTRLEDDKWLMLSQVGETPKKLVGAYMWPSDGFAFQAGDLTLLGNSGFMLTGSEAVLAFSKPIKNVEGISKFHEDAKIMFNAVLSRGVSAILKN